MNASLEFCRVAPDVVAPVEPRRKVGAPQLLNPLEHDGWDGLLGTHSDSSFFHTAAWAGVLRETYGFNPAYFTVCENTSLLSLLPVMEVNSRLTGRRGVALPFTDFCEMPDYDSTLKNLLIPAAIAYGRQKGWAYLEMRGARELFSDVPAWQSFLSHELKLHKDEGRMFAGFDSATRRAIRKSEKLGVIVEISDSFDAVQSFYALHCKTRKKHGLPPQPSRFFQNIHKHILSRQMGLVVTARRRQNIIAAAIFFHFGAKAIYKYGASDETFQELRGNNLVIWEAIKWYGANGAKALHFGRTSIANEGLRRFKLAWGSDEQTIEYLRYDLQKSCFVTGKDRVIGWYNTVFRALPIPLLRMIGRLLYRHAA